MEAIKNNLNGQFSPQGDNPIHPEVVTMPPPEHVQYIHPAEHSIISTSKPIAVLQNEVVGVTGEGAQTENIKTASTKVPKSIKATQI